MASARTTLPSCVVIDLTQSDEDEDIAVYNQLSREGRLHAPATRNSEALPTSNHGLALRDTINFGEQESKRDNGFGKGAWSGHGASPRSMGIASVGTIRFPLATHERLHRLPNGSNRSHTRSMDHNFHQAAASAVPLTNTAKRRKTHGGMTTASLKYGLNAQGPNGKDLQVSAIKPLDSLAASVDSSSSDASVIEVPTPRPSQNESRVSPQARQHPHKPRTYRLPEVNDRGDERVIEALDAQVFKHIKSALRRFRKTLSKVERMQIATKVTHKLIDEPGFLDDFEANDWTLPRDYESKLSAKAKLHVDMLASGLRRNSRRLQSIESTSSDSFGSGYGRCGSQSSQDIDQNISEDLDSSSGPQFQDEKVFANLPKTALPHYRLQSTPIDDYYSSPTTSVATEHLDRTSKDDAESLDPKRLKVKPQESSRQLRRSSRLLRSSVPPEITTDDNSRTRRAVNSKNNSSSNQYKPSIASIREAHALRISGLDNAARPYIRFADLDDIRRGCEVIKGDAGRYLSQEEREVLERSVLHVDFCVEEVELLYRLILNSNPPRGTELKSRFVSMIATLKQNIAAICKTVERKVSMGGKEFGLNLLRNRDTADIRSFLEDAACGNITITPRLVCVDLKSSRGLSVPKPSISSLIREREIWGMAPYRVCQGRQAFNVEIANHIEDSFLRRSEWTDCCGDISTVSWTGDHTFVCGATAHSDYHNMQYNKPGNLLVGSALLDTLRAVDGHRIMRPVVKKAENVENALESMRQTQDPWLYTSVVSTSYSAVSQYTFTASFDETVKVWKVTEDGSSMSLCGTWKHDGKVNFVVTSETHNQVATASDVSNNAIRVYKFDELDIPGTPHDTYSGDKAQEQAAELERSDSWAYFPATIQWGRAVSVANLLLVGYSPRSSSGHEVDIPEEKKNTGELCIWNVENGQRVQISSARTQNVFEVVWHQSQPMFLAATSPCGVFEPEVKTQIRLFALNQCGSFLHIKTLDCPALDINELTIQPTSLLESYVSASCTDGNTYIWDTAQGDCAIHVLGHGASLDNPLHDLPLEIADSGVKFASWGQSTGRFYTGSSDGKVKAWDVRAPKGEAYVRTVLSVSGGISAGAFSKDFSKLLIGDATGKVHLIEVGDSDDSGDPGGEDAVVAEQRSLTTSRDQPAMQSDDRSQQPLKRPKVLIPHPEPLPPSEFEHGMEEKEQTAHAMAEAYIESGQLIVHPDRGIGAIQGPNYADTLLYRFEAHEDFDGTKPLRPEWGSRQQCHLHSHTSQLQLPRLSKVASSNFELHKTNKTLDLDVSSLSTPVRESFAKDGIDLDFEQHHKFDLEPAPGYEIFKTKPRVNLIANLT